MIIPTVKTAIFGASGYIGRSVFFKYRKYFPDCLATSKTPFNCAVQEHDIIHRSISKLGLRENIHEQALILSSISKIAKCEMNRKKSYEINVKATLKLAQELANLGIKPIFFSSDVVFDGEKGNYIETDIKNPLNEYGKQKTEVENKISEYTNGNYLILRISKVYSLEKNDNTLLDEMAKKLIMGNELNEAYNQIFCPILLSDLIDILFSLQKINKLTGIVNVCGNTAWSRYDIATLLAKKMNLDSNLINRANIENIPLGYRRPKNTSLNIKKLASLIPLSFKSIEEACILKARQWSGIFA